jgi:hypothetical protein
MDNCITGYQLNATAILSILNTFSNRISSLERMKVPSITTSNSSNENIKGVLPPLYLTNGILSLSSISWTNISDKPSTAEGYGITNVVTKDSIYLNPSWIGSLSANKIVGLSAVGLSGSYNDLLNKPAFSQVQSDWNQNASSDPSFIKNKPTFATVSFSGSYVDLINKPTIPSPQINSDWSAVSGIAVILNKPVFATVATTGSYTDLFNKPTIFNGDYNNLTNKPTLFNGDYNSLSNKPSLSAVAISGNYSDVIGAPAQFHPIAGSGMVITGTYPNITFSSVSGGGGTVTSVSGTTNRITVTNPSTTPGLDIASTYIGQSSITTLGTIVSGVWHGSPIANAWIANSSININGTSISLGGTVTTNQNIQQVLTTGSVLSSDNTITVGSNTLKIGSDSDDYQIRLDKNDASINLKSSLNKIGNLSTSVKSKIGVFPTDDLNAAVAYATDTHTTLARTTIKLEATSSPATRYRTISDAGIEPVVTIGYFNLDNTHNFPTGTELTAYITKVTSYLDGMAGYNVQLITVENEENNDTYRVLNSNSADFYITQLSQTITLAHARGIKVANGGFTGHTMKYVVYNWLLTNGRTEDANLILNNEFTSGQKAAIIANTYTTTYANQLDIVNSVLVNGTSIDLDYINFHWYFGSGTSQPIVPLIKPALLAKEAFEALSGLPAIMDEVGQHNHVVSHPTDVLKELTKTGLPYIFWTDGDSSGGTYGLHEGSSGDLRPNGENFTSFIDNYYSSDVPFVVDDKDIFLNEAYEGVLTVDETGKLVSSSLNTYLKPENYVAGEIPSGTINGTNTVFTLVNIPMDNTETIFINGLYQHRVDYTITDNTITFDTAPTSGAKIAANYFKLI